jgi:hypothetical protein
MQRKCKERKRLKKLGFFFFNFLPIKAKRTKDVKRNCRIHDSGNSFFLKLKINIIQKILETKRDKMIFFILFHKQSQPGNYLNPKQQNILELRKT